MQRSITYKSFISYTAWAVLFALYTSFSTIYLFLPPMMSILFFLFNDALKKNDSTRLFFLVTSIFILEAQKGFLGFTVVIFFLLLYRFFIPKLDQSINASSLRKFLYVVSVYIGYVFFSTLLSQIFLLRGISIDFYIVYYIIIEYIIVSLLL